MSKSRKLLAFLLIAVLTVGAVCIAASAEDEPGRVTYPTVNTDFEKWAYDYNANEGDTATAAKGLQIAFDKTYGHLSTGNVKDAGGENTYLRFWNDKGDAYTGTGASTSNPWMGIYGGGYGNNNAWRLVEYDYVTLEYEFCSDRYMDPDTREFLDEYVDGAVLAYPESAYFDVYIRSHPNAGSTYYANKCNSIQVKFEFKASEGRWYLVVGGTARYALPKEAGVWTHLTFVIAVDNTPIYAGNTLSGWKLSDTDIYIYADGNHVYTANNVIKTDVNEGATVTINDQLTSLCGFEQIRVNIPSTVRNGQSFSLCFDNIQTNYYKPGYESGLDEVLADTTKNLAEAEGALIGGVYNRPYPTKPVASLDGTDFYYPEGAHHYIKRDSVLEIFKDFTTSYYVDTPFIVKSNGYNFNFTTDKYELQKVGNNYYFVNTTDPIRIIFDGDPNSAYKGPLYNDSLQLAINAIPKYPTKIPKELEYTYHPEDGKIWHLIGWSTEKDSTTPMDPLPSITQDDIYYGCYYLYPVYEKVEAAYFTETGEGADIVRIGYSSYETLVDSLKTDGIKIVFNGSYTSTEILSIENDIALVPNGNTIYYYSETKIADVEGGVYTFRDVRDEEKLTINWYAVGDDELKNPIGTMVEIPGNSFDYTVFNKKIVSEAYSESQEKILEYTGWSVTKDNAGVTLVDKIYTIPIGTTELNFYPTYMSKDCAFYVEYNGVKTGYLDYAKVEDFTTLSGAIVHFVTPYNEMLYIEEKVTLVPYENNFVYYSESKIAEVVDGKYVFRDVRPTDYVEVKWTDLKGAVVKTEKHIPGNTVNTPKMNVKTDGNLSEEHSTSFYKIYLAWEKQYTIQPLGNGGENPNVYAPTNATAGEAILVTELTGLKYSFSALTDFKLNIYVPDPKDENIKLSGSTSAVTIGGADYIKISDVATIDPANTDSVSATISFTLYNSAETWDVTVSLSEYFSSILTRPDATDEEKELIIAAVNYCNLLYKAKNGTDYEPYKTIVDNNTSFFTSIDTIIQTDGADATNGTTSTRVTPYIAGMKVFYDPETKAVLYGFIVNTSVVSGNYAYTPASRPVSGGLKGGEFGIEVTINGKAYGTKLIDGTDANGNAVKMLVPDLQGDSVSILSMNDPIKFTIYRREYNAQTDSKVTGASNKSYSMSIYLVGAPATEDISILKAIYAYSYAAKQYNDDDTVITDVND